MADGGRDCLVKVIIVVVGLVVLQVLFDRNSATITTTVFVHRVIDGDTVTYKGPHGEERHVRLVGIDTPERGEKGYQEAKDYLNQRVQGREVTLKIYTIDVYGREIADLYDQHGLSVPPPPLSYLPPSLSSVS